MLVLSRKAGESILIGAGDSAVRVTVLGFWKGQVRLDVQAPRAVRVLRGELRDRDRSQCGPGRESEVPNGEA